MSNRQWYPEYQKQLEEEQSGMTRQELATMLDNQYVANPVKVNSDGQPVIEKKFDYVFDPMNAPKQLHRWIDRGLKMSCEGAGHPFHQAYKRLPMY